MATPENPRYIGNPTDFNPTIRHNYDTFSKKYDTALRLYRVGNIYYYRRKYKGKLYRISLRTKEFKTAVYRKRFLDLVKGEELFKLKTADYELIFEYDTKEELEAYLQMTQKDRESMLNSLEQYDSTNNLLERQAKKDVGNSVNFRELEFKFVEAKKKLGTVSKSSYKAYNSTYSKLFEYFRNKAIIEIEIEDYEGFRDYLRDKHKLKNTTINNHITYVNKFLDFAVSRKLIPENNLKGLENLKAEEVNKENFTDEEMKQIIAYDYPTEIKNFFKIAMYSGMRLGEIHSLTNENIKSEDGVYYFDVVSSKTKSGIRKVPIHYDILEDVLLMDLPLLKGKSKDATQKVVNRHLYKVIDKNSTKSFHTFRAKFIEKAVNANPKDVLIVQEIVGHSKNEKDKLTIDGYGKGFKLDLKVPIVNSVEYK